jgi:hypothetical protein
MGSCGWHSLEAMIEAVRIYKNWILRPMFQTCELNNYANISILPESMWGLIKTPIIINNENIHRFSWSEINVDLHCVGVAVDADLHWSLASLIDWSTNACMWLMKLFHRPFCLIYSYHEANLVSRGWLRNFLIFYTATVESNPSHVPSL